MEVLHESYPFLIGLLLSPLLMAVQAIQSRLWRLSLPLLPAIAVGSCVSALNGELAVGFPEGLFAVAADSMLVYAGAFIAYYLGWRRLQLRAGTATFQQSEPEA